MEALNEEAPNEVGVKEETEVKDVNQVEKCSVCGVEFRRETNYKKTWRTCRKCWNEYNRNRYRNRKQMAVVALGGSCFSCGFDDWRVLQIVRRDLRSIKPGQSSRILTNIIEDENFRKDYALFCMNCLFLGRRYGVEKHG